MDFKKVYQYTKNLKILYVEDDENISKHVNEILQSLFKKVVFCKDGQDGLYEYKRGEFDIVLTDLYMPRLDGLQMIEKIVSINPKQIISVFTGKEESSSLKKLINLNINSFLLKPLDKEQLAKTLQRLAKIIVNEKLMNNYLKNIEHTNAFLEKKLKFALETNYLTKLKNRDALIKDIDEKKYTMLAFVDIDNLQFINDLYGSTIGNIIIKKFGKMLEKEVDKRSYGLYQTTADEFAIASEGDDSKEFEEFIHSLSKEITNLTLYIDEIDDDINIDATIGVTYEMCMLASCGIMYESHLLLAQAHTALKYAKKHNLSLVSYNESINELQNIQNILHWKQMIKDAYNEHRIVPVYQPIVDKNAKILKYETLMRIRDKEDKDKLITPYYFLDIAIMTKQYHKLSFSIIKEALLQLKLTENTLSVNLTYSDIENDEITEYIYEYVKNYNVKDRLIIEIVESEDIRDYDLFLNFIKKVKKHGVKIAMDDFGSGFSNFENIIKIGADYIKIDGSLIKNINKDKNSYAIVKAIVQFAHTLGIKLIAEYVHSKEVLEVLKELDIDEYQGFYFYEPSPEFVSEKFLV